jgi:hypothetical protein
MGAIPSGGTGLISYPPSARQSASGEMQKGADETSMEAWKIRRAEDLSWNPPHLSFTIERHGPTVHGRAAENCISGRSIRIWRPPIALQGDTAS